MRRLNEFGDGSTVGQIRIFSGFNPTDAPGLALELKLFTRLLVTFTSNYILCTNYNWMIVAVCPVSGLKLAVRQRKTNEKKKKKDILAKWIKF